MTPYLRTTKEFLRGTLAAAHIAPPATPKATIACKIAPCDKSMSNVDSAHFKMMNCKVAPIPQKRVVTAKEI